MAPADGIADVIDSSTLTSRRDSPTTSTSGAEEASPGATPRVSLVIPMYNSSAFITTALASVAGQTRPVDEVVVVDDASTDNGAALATRWTDILPLRVMSHDHNRGLGAARRTGIAGTSGELIALLDADDVWLPDHLETMLETHRRHGGLITADTLWWRPTCQLSTVSGRTRKRVPPLPRQRLGILERNFVHPISLFSRADYDRAGGFSELRQMEDWDLWMRMVRCGIPVTMAPTPTALYRVHGASLSAGRGTLSANVVQLPKYLPQLDPDERRVLRRTIRRRTAWLDLLAGEQQAVEGRLRQAMSLWTRAIVQDRRVRGGLTGAYPSVTLQAVANLATGGWFGKLRRTRAGSTGTGLRQR